MITEKYLLALLFLCIFLISPIYSDNHLFSDSIPPENIVFERYGADEGLANLVVYDIVQDRKGFLWLSTGNGLSRFDGYEFTNYISDPDDPGSIGKGPATDILIDSSDRLWVSVLNAGLFLYNEKSNDFSSYTFDTENEFALSSNAVYSLAEDHNGHLWISTLDGGLNRLDPDTGEFVHYKHYPNDSNSISSDNVTGILVDRENVLWISTIGKGLNRYDIAEDIFSVPLENLPQSVSLTEASNGDIWIPTMGSGLYRYNRSSENFTQFLYNESDASSLSHNITVRVLEDSLGTVWISTWGGGLNVYDRERNDFIHYKSTPENSNSLSSDNVWGLFEDKTGVFWAGTYGSGINRYDRKTERFSVMKHHPNKFGGLSHNNVKAVFEDSSSKLWIGTLGGGLNLFDPNSGLFKTFRFDPADPGSISNDFVSMVDEDAEKNIWVATDKGLNKLNINDGRFYHYLDEAVVRSVYVDSFNDIWVGTQLQGMFRYDSEEDMFVQYPFVGAYISVIYEDRNGGLWHGTLNGLYKYDRRDDVFTRALEDPSVKGSYLDLLVTAMQDDDKGNLWIGSTTQLIRMNRDNGSLTIYNREDDLADDNIAGLAFDNQNNLWISTSNGISVYQRDEDQFRNYEIGSFNRNSSLITERGELYFGSFNGLVHFFAEDIRDNAVSPPVVLTSFKIFNEEVDRGGPVSELTSFELNYDENFFSFEFSALDYSDPQKNQYRYKLEGFDSNWIDVPSGRRYASYTNLDGGDYVFRVIASNSDGLWNMTGLAVNLQIVPRFVDTPEFLLLLAIAILLIIGLVTLYIAKLLKAIRKQKISEGEIQELRSYQADIIDSMPSVLVGVDKQGYVTQWNRTAVEYTSISIEDARGKALADLLPELASEIGKLNQSISSGEIFRNVNKPVATEEDIRYKNVTIYPLSGSSREGAVIRIDDVTKNHDLLERLNHRSKMDGIGQLAGGMAHDFNNMLSGIINAAQLLKSAKRNIDEKGLKYVDLILQASIRASELTAKLLAFGRKGKVAVKTLDMHMIIDDVVDILKRTVDKKINITVNKQAGDYALLGDFSALQSALLNLGINASHAMPEGGEISITTENIILSRNYCEASPFEIEPGEYCKIEISDTGMGIPVKNLKRIFEPFYTTKDPGKGTGLGLAAVYGTILDHHGEINVYSDLGEGASFHLNLPCSESRPESVQKPDDVMHGSGVILLVDDEDIIRLTGKDLLENMGYEVLLAVNGKEACDVFQEKHDSIDLVLMDMIMPEMNGCEAFYKMRDIDKDAKIIISSGFAKNENIANLLQEGLSGFISKPFKEYELSLLLSKLLL